MSTSPKQISSFLQAWHKWKSLRLPWRKHFLVGRDLQGNTFWEFRDTRGTNGPGRFRRIVKYPRSTHLSDVQVSPLWHQWLRYTREHPPSVDEQTADVARQERMKMLAAQADAKWARVEGPNQRNDEIAGQSVPKQEETPTSTHLQSLPVRESGRPPIGKQLETLAEGPTTGLASDVQSAQEQSAEVHPGQRQATARLAATDAPRARAATAPSERKPQPPEDPWDRAKGPSENWQPTAWTPTPGRRGST